MSILKYGYIRFVSYKSAVMSNVLNILKSLYKNLYQGKSAV